MASAEELILSVSAFSYAAALMSRGVVHVTTALTNHTPMSNWVKHG